MMQHLATVTTFVCVCGGSVIRKGGPQVGCSLCAVGGHALSTRGCLHHPSLCFLQHRLAAVLLLILLGVMGWVDDGIDAMVANVACFGTARTCPCHALTLSVPPVSSFQRPCC
jgi:hypothetical protein